MTAVSISLGDRDRVAKLYSYPNQSSGTDTLEETVFHWFNLTLERDGLKGEGASASVRIEGEEYFLDLDGPPSVQDDLQLYAERLPQFLDHGWAALSVIEDLKTAKPDVPWPKELEGASDKLWDPMNTGNWRFFLPLGMAMARQRSLNVLHYPPRRLLDGTRDYLRDPVPTRLIELAVVNGASRAGDVLLYQTVMDVAPIAADDDQGTIYLEKDGHTDYRNPVHLIPTQHFPDYQRDQIRLLLNISSENDAYTVPITVYGTPARNTFEELYRVKLNPIKATTVNIIPDKTTPVIASGHPYAFYAQIQAVRSDAGEDQARVGSGRIDPEKCPSGVKTMISDLIIAGWQRRMNADPSQAPNAVVDELTAYWNAPEQRSTVCELVQHQGSLFYADPDSLDFTFRLSQADAAKFCANHGNDPCAFTTT